MAYCPAAFTITVLGEGVARNCKMSIDTSFDAPTYQAGSLTSEGTVLNVPYTYQRGSPPRTHFHSIITATRTGASGSPPGISGTFVQDLPLPATPTENGTGTFQLTLPTYSEAAAMGLAGGSDSFTVTLYVHEAGDF